MSVRSVDGEHRRLDQQHEGQRQQGIPVPHLPALVEGEGGHHADRPVREVEDARGVVGHHQSHGGDGVNGPGRDAQHRERQELAHVTALRVVIDASPTARALAGFKRGQSGPPIQESV
jgi:hypothetical protein